jgi:hypothetical protein
MCPKKGQYNDGHERPDVVYYQEHIYLPQLFKLQCHTYIYDNDGGHILAPFPKAGQRVLIWYHDESIFYAHDQQRKSWYHKDCDAVPYRKGEGASFMVADFFSTDFGWLRDHVGQRNARATIRPGKNQDSYFTAQEVCEQASQACQIVRGLWPDFDHIFIYDNATTHCKHADGSLSACCMPKFPSGSRGKANSNFLVETN